LQLIIIIIIIRRRRERERRRRRKRRRRRGGEDEKEGGGRKRRRKRMRRRRRRRRRRRSRRRRRRATASPAQRRKPEVSDSLMFPVGYVTISSQMQQLPHKLGHNHFLLCPFHFIFPRPSCRPTSFTPSYRQFRQIKQNKVNASCNISHVYVA
jgi:hypothetical protein